MFCFVFLLTSLFVSCNKEGQSAAKTGLETLTINGINLYVELAITLEEQRRGLMFREQLEKDHGMLFIFHRERQASFWMKNTLIPLSIAFIKEDGWISQIDEMEPQSLSAHVSDMKVKYVLEMNKGWFDEHGIKIGDMMIVSNNIINLIRSKN